MVELRGREESRPVSEGGEGEEAQNGGPEIGETLASSQGSGGEGGAEGEEGDILSGVVGSRVVGVTSVIGGDDQEIPQTHPGKDPLSQEGVELFQSPGVADAIVSVAEKHVEIHKVHEDEALLEGLHLPHQSLHPLTVVVDVEGVGEPSACEDVSDLADSPHRKSRGGEAVENRLSYRL